MSVFLLKKLLTWCRFRWNR